jgi:hypothetical protein
MLKKYLPVFCMSAVAVGCSTLENSMGSLTVKDYTSKSGQRVMAGQAQPKAGYNCRLIAEEKQDWGIAGNMNKVASTEKLTAAAVEAAPSKGANYAHIMIPSETSIGGFNTHAFSDAKVVYYKCENLPAPAK